LRGLHIHRVRIGHGLTRLNEHWLLNDGIMLNWELRELGMCRVDLGEALRHFSGLRGCQGLQFDLIIRSNTGLLVVVVVVAA
jgi:hypothetical protein